jgi:hypothetical protein
MSDDVRASPILLHFLVTFILFTFFLSICRLIHPSSLTVPPHAVDHFIVCWRVCVRYIGPTRYASTSLQGFPSGRPPPSLGLSASTTNHHRSPRCIFFIDVSVTFDLSLSHPSFSTVPLMTRDVKSLFMSSTFNVPAPPLLTWHLFQRHALRVFPPSFPPSRRIIVTALMSMSAPRLYSISTMYSLAKEDMDWCWRGRIFLMTNAKSPHRITPPSRQKTLISLFMHHLLSFSVTSSPFFPPPRSLILSCTCVANKWPVHSLLPRSESRARSWCSGGFVFEAKKKRERESLGVFFFLFTKQLDAVRTLCPLPPSPACGF